MGRNVFARVVLLSALLSVDATGADAQAVYGSLVGNVTDTTGGAIPGATVTATHTQTNLTREVVTNASGASSIPNIPSGTYQVVVAVPGFQTFTARDVIVTNRDMRVDAKLGLGTLEEALTVTATAAILQTENAAVQHIANSEQLQTLPTSGRAFQSFMTLMPGVADPNYQQSGGINNPGPDDVADGQRPAGDQHGGSARRHHRDQPVLRKHPELRPQPRGDRDRQRRHQQLRRRSGHGGCGRGQRAGEDRHEQFPRLGVRIRHRCADARPELLSARRSRQGDVERQCIRRHAWAVRLSRTSCSSS